MIRIIESPREGMQGFPRIIPTMEKVRYINELLKVGFDVVEVGSRVSPKIIPQMADSMEVLNLIDFTGSRSGRMVLATGVRSVELLALKTEITHISYPFSFSPAFLRLNLNTTVEQSLETVGTLTNLSLQHGKHAVIYISMAFGNPYAEPWSHDILAGWVRKLYQAGATTIVLSNVSIELDPLLIFEVYSRLIPLFPAVELGLHLHTTNYGWYEQVNAAYMAGCRRFDSVTGGHGGCPMTGKKMLGNLDTRNLLEFATKKKMTVNIDRKALEKAYEIEREIFDPSKPSARAKERFTAKSYKPKP
ncbi:MAG: hydroxymethylglutaryl-CoA lyase [Bacteroidota bacterium]